MWIVETGEALLNGKHFVVQHTSKFLLKKLATEYFNKYCDTYCQGGTGYWHLMRVKSARMYEM